MEHLTEHEQDLLADLLPPGGKLYVLERHISRSGDTLYLQALVVQDNEIQDISWLVGKILDSKWKYSANRKALKISAVENAGTDFAFQLADDLSTALHPEAERLQHIWI